jgi:hypothetical protein
LTLTAVIQKNLETPSRSTTTGQKRAFNGVAEIDGILRQLPAERHEMSGAAFHDLLVILKYGIAGGKLLFTMTSCSHLPGIVGISPE